MSKEEYADETEKYVACFLKGKKEERERIIKLIDSRIADLHVERKNLPHDIIPTAQTITWYGLLASVEHELEELKEELKEE